MQFVRGVENLAPHHKPCVVSIGNYDGVHLGHQMVIKSLLEQREIYGVPATVLTFEPLAKEFFSKQKPARLSSIEQRADMLFALGVDQVCCVEFNREFASLAPEQFVQTVLIDGLAARYVAVGDDFRFGKDREGDFVSLQQAGKQHGFVVVDHGTFEIDGERVSSGRIRSALQRDDLLLAERLLGKPYSISGMVQHGRKLGREIGFPTANIPLSEQIVLPVQGVYVVEVTIVETNTIEARVDNKSAEKWQGVANIGKRPTVNGNSNQLEVHLLNVQPDLYDCKLEVVFKQKIRDEQKFEDIESLKQQIAKDIIIANAFFAT